MADNRHEMVLALNVEEFGRGLDMIERRLARFNAMMSTSKKDVTLFNPEAVRQYADPKAAGVRATPIDVQRQAQLAAAIATKQIVDVQSRKGQGIGRVDSKNTAALLEMSKSEAIANLRNSLGKAFTGDLVKRFETQFDDTITQFFSDLRRDGAPRGAGLRQRFVEVASPQLAETKPQRGKSVPGLSLVPSTGKQFTAQLQTEFDKFGTLASRNDASALENLAAQQRVERQEQQRQAARKARIDKEEAAVLERAGGGGVYYLDNPEAKSVDLMGAHEQLEQMAAQAAINSTLLMEETLRERLVNLDVVNKYYGRLQEILARENITVNEQFRSLTQRFEMNAVQERIASLRGKLTNRQYVAAAQEANILQSQLKSETRIPAAEAARRRVDNMGYQANAAGFLVRDEALKKEATNSAQQKGLADKELNLAIRQANLNDTVAESLRIVEAGIGIRESIANKEARNFAQTRYLDNPEVGPRQVAADVDGATLGKRRKNAAKEEALSRQEYIVATNKEEILKLEEEAGRLSARGDTAEAQRLQRIIGQRRAYLSELRELPPDVAASFFAGRAGREAAKYTAISANPALADQLAADKASAKAIKAQINAASQEKLLADERYVTALALEQKNKITKSALDAQSKANSLREFAEDPVRYSEYIKDTNTTSLLERKLAADQRSAMLNNPEYAEVTLQEQINALRAKNIAKEAEVNNQQLMALRIERRMLEMRDAQVEASIQQQAMVNLTGRGGGRISGWLDRVGMSGGGGGRGGGGAAQLAGDPGGFFLGGALSSLKYGVGSAVLYGGFRVISEAVKDSEELNITLGRLESQLAEVDQSGETFVKMRDDIISLSKETGVLTNEIAKMAAKIQGAFGDLKYDPNDPTGSMGGLRGNDNRIRYGQDAVDRQTEAVAKLVKITGLSEQVVSDEIMAASVSFGAGADLISDVIIRLEEASGVMSGDIATFLGDVGPSARAAGFELQEFAAIGATVLQSTSVGPAALAEQMGRVIASMTKDTEKYFQLAYDNQQQLMNAGDYDAFIQAIQDRDPSEIFMVMNRNYKEWSKASQDFVVEMLGGQRQANTVKALFGGSDKIQKLTGVGEDSAGATEKRWEKLEQKMSVVVAKLDMAFNEIVRAFLDAGIADAVISIASTFTTMVQILGSVVGIWTDFDEALGGSLSKITGFAIQVALIKGLITAIKLMGNTGRGQRLTGFAGDVIGGMGGGMGGRATPVGWHAPMALPPTRMERFNTIRQTRGVAGVAAGAGAAGKGLMAALGGPLGLAFTGVTVATMAYSSLKASFEADREAVTALLAEKMDSGDSAEQLRAQADRVRSKESNFTRLKNTFSPSYVSEAEGLDVAADFKEVENTANKLIEMGSIDPESAQAIIRGYQGVADSFSGDAIIFNKLLEVEEFRNQIIGGASEAFTNETLGALKINGKSLATELKMTPEEFANITGFGDIAPALAANGIDFDEFFKQSLRESGFGEIADALAESNPAQALRDLIIETGDKDVKDKAIVFLQFLQDNRKELINKAYNDAKELGNLATNKDESISSAAIDALRMRYESGEGTFSSYISALDRLIEDIENSDDADMERLFALRAEKATAIAKNLKDASDRLLEMDALIYGGDDRGQLQTIAANLELLGNKDFTGPEREEAAKAVLAAQRNILDRMVSESESIEEINRLMNEGIEIPLPAAVTAAAVGVKATDEYRELAESFKKVEDNLDIIASKNTPRKTSQEDFKASLTAKFGSFDPDEILSSVLAEVGATGKVSEETVKKYTDVWRTLQGYLKDASLPQETRDALTGAVSFIERLFKDIRVLAIEQQLSELDKKSKGQNWFQKVGSNAQKGNLQAQLAAAQAAPNTPFGADIRTRMFADMEAADEQRKQLADEQKKTQEDIASARLELAKAIAEDAGDIVGAARLGVQQAQAALAFLRQTGGSQSEILRAEAQIVAARGALREAIAEERDAKVALLKVIVGKDDPLLNAQFDLNLAKVQESEARGVKAKADAAIARIEAERAVAAEIADVRLSQMELRRVQLEAIDDEVGAAYVDSQIAQQQIADAINRGAGKAEMARLQGALISADKNVSDVLLQSKLEEYDYLLNTGQLTQRQYVEYLEGLKSTLDPASKQFKDLERQLYSLKQSIGADLQMNLPTNLSLPTLYEARRLNQSGSMGGGSAQAQIGYQDNRNMNVEIVISRDMSESQILDVLSNALGTGRNALTVSKRY